MLFTKVLGLLFITIGSVSILNGLTPPAIAAVECNGGIIYDGMECDPAHARQLHITLTANMRCEDNSPRTNCFPTTESQCGSLEGFQVAVNGLCVVTPESSDKIGCQEDNGTTFIALDYYSSTCKYKNGVCACVLIGSATHPTQYSEQCTCSE